jgi:biopolymer transport protein ExbB
MLMLAASLTQTAHSNPLVDLFIKGGPIMWPLLVVSIVALTVIAERIIWWSREKRRREPEKVEKVFACVESGDLKQASTLSRSSEDPVLRMMWHGLNHYHASLEGALQVAAGIEVQRASRFLPVMDTIITLAPLLGLLGTVTGIMGAFRAVSESGLDPNAVSGGIGEALIATATGLGIAMVTLIPYNYFTSKVERLKFELETASTNVVVMTDALGKDKLHASELQHAG